MTDWEGNLRKETTEIFSAVWDDRQGRVVPESEDVKINNGASQLTATFLYADLAASSRLAEVCPWETTAKIIKAYLHCCIRLIRAYGGHIRSFDGDRVMGIFAENSAVSSAVRCAREINFATTFIIDSAASSTFGSVKNNGISIQQSVGVATGLATAVRAGIRNNNDLIWIGRAPALAAKLSDVRLHPYCVYIDAESFQQLSDADKFYNGTFLWEARAFNFGASTITVYRSNWWLRP